MVNIPDLHLALALFLSGILVRAIAGVFLARGYLNVEEKPLSAMGLVAGILAALAWWAVCLVSGFGEG